MQSIANFAESLVLGELEGSEKKASTNSPWGDIREVSVPDSLRKGLIESAISHDPNSVEVFIPETEPETEVQEPQETYDVEYGQDDLVNRLEGLLHEFKEVLSEMTSCGMLGVNMSGSHDEHEHSKGKKKKHLPIKAKKKKKFMIVIKP